MLRAPSEYTVEQESLPSVSPVKNESGIENTRITVKGTHTTTLARTVNRMACEGLGGRVLVAHIRISETLLLNAPALEGGGPGARLYMY